MERKKTIRGLLCALAGGTLWGVSGTVGQYLFTYKGLDSQWITVVRMLTAGFVLLAYLLCKNPRALVPIWKNKRDTLQMLLFAVLGLMACQLTYMTAISYSNSATATALQYLGQALVLLVTCVQIRRLPTGKEGFALLLAVSGVFLLATHGNLHSLVLSPEALFWGLGAAVALVMYTLLPVSILRKYGSIPVTAFSMLIGGMVLAMVTQVWEVEVTFDLAVIVGVFFIAIFGTAIALTLYLQGVSDVGGVKASLLACAEPVSAAIVTTLWLKTSLAPLDWIAFAMILFMSFLLVMPKKRNSLHIKQNIVE